MTNRCEQDSSKNLCVHEETLRVIDILADMALTAIRMDEKPNGIVSARLNEIRKLCRGNHPHAESIVERARNWRR